MGSRLRGGGTALDGVRVPLEGGFLSKLTFGGSRREFHKSAFSNTEGKTVSRLALSAKGLDLSFDRL